MKKARLVIAMVLVAMMTSMFSFASADTIAISATADKTEVEVGDTVTVTFEQPASVLTGINIGVTWDKDKLEFLGVPFDADEDKIAGSVYPNAFPFGPNNHDGAGAVCAVSGTKPAKAGVIFTAQFKVLSTDATVTAYVAEALGKDDVDVTADVTVGTVQFTAKAAPTTTEPTTTEAPTTEAPTTEAPETTTVADEEETTVADDETATDVETAVEVETKTETTKTNPTTGVVACTAAVVALAASGVVLVKSKRK